MRLRGPRAGRGRLVAVLWLLAAPSCLCRQITSLEIDDGGPMIPPDAGFDAGFDGGLDAGPDAGEDAGPDAGEDAGPDAGEDAGADAGSEDAGEVVGYDAGPMGMPDAGYGKCGAGSELTSYVTYGEVFPLEAVASADMNGDGVLDLIEYEQFASYFDIWFGLLDGGLGSRTTYDAGMTTYDAGIEYLAVGDVNGDGMPDLVVWDNGGLLTVYLNDGGGGLNPGATAQASGLPYVVAIGDLNGDGRGDIVVGYADEVLQIFLGEPDGGFSAPLAVTQALSGYNFASQLAVGDLNGDGLADIVANTPDQGHLIVLLSQGDGGFQTSTYDPPAIGQILLLPNGTATPDLVVGQNGEGPAGLESTLGFSVFHNKGDGTFEAGQTYSVVGYGLAIGDFNGDCVPDIATTANSSLGCQAGWGTSVLYGDGDGGFGHLEFLPAPGNGPYGPEVLGPVSHPNLIAIGDACRDGGLTVYGDTSGP